MVTIDGYKIDAAPAEDHSFNSQVTSHPVEKGADVSDHVRPMPEMVVLDCVVSDTPIGDIADERALSGSEPSAEAFSRLIAIRDAREPVTVETTLTTFTNMILESLSIPTRDGDALHFKATFRELVIVEADRSKRVEVPRAAKKAKRGNKPSKEVKADEFNPVYRMGGTRSSMLDNLVSKF